MTFQATLHHLLTQRCAMRKSGGMPRNSPLVTSAEACRTLGVDRSTLSRWVTSGRIVPVLKLPGSRGAFLFAPVEVERVASEMAA